LHFPPDAVVRPATAEEVSRILALCNGHRIPVTPRGGGTGLSGGALAVHGGVVLSIERMNRILEVDQENLMGVVEPGVVTQVYQEAVEAVGLYYPPDPASRGSCLMGGNVAENAGGPHAVKYGVTKDWIIGLEVVLPTGEVIQTGGKLLKNVSGYNITQLMVGSEGTLGVVTKIITRLIPLPTHRRALLVPFDSLGAAARCITALFHAKVIPSAAELMERSAIQAAEEHLGKKFPHGDAAALVLLEVDGHDESDIERQTERIAEVVTDLGIDDVFVADGPEQVRELWALRRSIGLAVKSISIYKEEDTVAPRARLADLVDRVKEVSDRHGLTTICYGHAGDGNIHVNIIKVGISDEDWAQRLPVAIREMFGEVVKLGGQISGEHGIGYVQKEFLPIAVSEAELELCRRIKRAFDPNGILNPGKIF
ncbi:MAG TPA: FAD-linked oxidase C-terminal domain-containing protein, partial [bacterium]|nr:FAD-linked oxidase C-terminal domain-containing protein [bacterium]